VRSGTLRRSGFVANIDSAHRRLGVYFRRVGFFALQGETVAAAASTAAARGGERRAKERPGVAAAPKRGLQRAQRRAVVFGVAPASIVLATSVIGFVLASNFTKILAMAAAALSFGTAAPAERGAFLHATRRRPRRGREGCGRGGRSGSQLEFEVDVDIFQQGEDLETRRREWPCERGSQDQDVAKPFKNLPKMKSQSH
jgi:hypothetical protein